jgi:hypothetical protein
MHDLTRQKYNRNLPMEHKSSYLAPSKFPKFVPYELRVTIGYRQLNLHPGIDSLDFLEF